MFDSSSFLRKLKPFVVLFPHFSPSLEHSDKVRTAQGERGRESVYMYVGSNYLFLSKQNKAKSNNCNKSLLFIYVKFM